MKRPSADDLNTAMIVLAMYEAGPEDPVRQACDRVVKWLDKHVKRALEDQAVEEIVRHVPGATKKAARRKLREVRGG